jgi:hypothetical protein
VVRAVTALPTTQCLPDEKDEIMSIKDFYKAIVVIQLNSRKVVVVTVCLVAGYFHLVYSPFVKKD